MLLHGRNFLTVQCYCHAAVTQLLHILCASQLVTWTCQNSTGNQPFLKCLQDRTRGRIDNVKGAILSCPDTTEVHKFAYSTGDVLAHGVQPIRNVIKYEMERSLQIFTHNDNS